MSGSIFTSSIGKKMFMSITGAMLVLFLAFHMLMNLVLIFSGSAYNAICEFLGANWYALLATVVLAVGVGLHFVLAIVLTLQNLRARGRVRYEASAAEQGVAWASKNMLVLGLCVILGLGLHLLNFWSKMQLVELLGTGGSMIGGEFITPTDGAAIVRHTFGQWYFALLYIIWLGALWFHLTHGVWSMFQSLGLNNRIWYGRLKFVSNVVATLVVGGFALTVFVVFLQQVI